MYKNQHDINRIDKQIILLSKCWFNDYLDSNKIELSRIEIIKYMIANYCGGEAQYISTNDVFFWVSRLYCYLSDSGLFPDLSTKNLIDRFIRVLHLLIKTENTQEEQLIDTLLCGISMTEAKGLNELGIDLGEPDFAILKEIPCIKDVSGLIKSSKEDEYIVFRIGFEKHDYVLIDGSVDKVNCVNRRWFKNYDPEDVIEADFKDVHNIRYIKKNELITI